MADALQTLSVKSRQHKWDHDNQRRLAASAFPDGVGRTERDCLHCGMVRITLHYPEGFPGREWRTKAGGRWYGQATPPCVDEVTS